MCPSFCRAIQYIRAEKTSEIIFHEFKITVVFQFILELMWDKFIIEPEGFYTGICLGSCSNTRIAVSSLIVIFCHFLLRFSRGWEVVKW